MIRKIGGVAERPIAPVLKTGDAERCSRVRISPPPLASKNYFDSGRRMVAVDFDWLPTELDADIPECKLLMCRTSSGPSDSRAFFFARPMDSFSSTMKLGR